MRIIPWIEGQPITVKRKPSTILERIKCVFSNYSFIDEKIIPTVNDVHFGKWFLPFPTEYDYNNELLQMMTILPDITHMVGIVYEKPKKIFASYKGFHISYCYSDSIKIDRIFDLNNDNDVDALYKTNKWAIDHQPAFTQYRNHKCKNVLDSLKKIKTSKNLN